MKRGKRYQESAKLVDEKKLYDAKEALKIIEKMPQPKFDQTVELHVKLGVDSKYADQQSLHPKSEDFLARRDGVLMLSALALQCTILVSRQQ